MSDESLRELERRVAESPHDLGVRRALLRALERAGDEKRAFDERVRLARLGDLEARSVIGHLSPALGTVFPGRRSGLREPHRAKKRVGRITSLGAPFIYGATDGLAFAAERGRQAVSGIDLRSLSVRWTLERPMTVTYIVGSNYALMAANGEGLDVVDGQGEIVRRIAFDGGPAAIGGEGDRFVLLHHTARGRRAEAIDIPSAESLWTVELPDFMWQVEVGGGRVFLQGKSFDDKRQVFEQRDGGTGELDWTRELETSGRDEDAFVDPRGVVFSYREHLIAFDAEEARDARIAAPGKIRGLHADYERVLVARSDVLELVDLSQRRNVWQTPLPVEGHVKIALAGEHAWVVHEYRVPGRVEVSAYEARNGLRVRHDVLHVPGATMAQIVPLDGAIVVFARGGDRDAELEKQLVVMRLEDEPSSPTGLRR